MWRDSTSVFRRRTKQTNLAKVQPSCFRRLLRFSDGPRLPDSIIVSAMPFALSDKMVNGMKRGDQ
jgi:hypothetical protein